jgi:hypothetical protein
MPRIKRWFPVSQGINGSVKTWEMTDRFGDRSLRVWLEMLSMANHNDGTVGDDSPDLRRVLANRCRVTGQTVANLWSWLDEQLWITRGSTVRIAKWLKYNSSRETINFPTGEFKNAHTTQYNTIKKKRDVNPSDSPINEFLKVYVSYAPKLPQPREVTTGRASKIRARLKEHDMDFWREVFTKANKSPFLCGDNDRGWKANLDWFISNDENAVKVLEGTYEKAKEQPTGQNLTDFDAIYRAQQERKGES